LKAFQEEKRISWDDFAEKEIFFDIKGNDRDIQLRNVLAPHPVRFSRYC